MNTFVSRIRSKTSFAISLYLFAILSLGFLAHAQINAMQLLPSSSPAALR